MGQVEEEKEGGVVTKRRKWGKVKTRKYERGGKKEGEKWVKCNVAVLGKRTPSEREREREREREKTKKK